MCPRCRSTDVRWEPTSGTRHASGRSSSRTRRCCPRSRAVAPYNAIVVELDEDPTIRFVGNLVASADGAINEIDPATIAIGEPVRVVFHQIDDVTLPAGSEPDLRPRARGFAGSLHGPATWRRPRPLRPGRQRTEGSGPLSVVRSDDGRGGAHRRTESTTRHALGAVVLGAPPPGPRRPAPDHPDRYRRDPDHPVRHRSPARSR